MRSKTKTDLWSEKLLKSIYFGNRIIEWIVEESGLLKCISSESSDRVGEGGPKET